MCYNQIPMTVWTCLRSCGRIFRIGQVENTPPACPECGRRMGRENRPKPQEDRSSLRHDRAAARRLGL